MICRVCGTECGARELRPIHEGGGCKSCNGSPACTRCGHSRRRHSGAFSDGEPGCTVRVAVDAGLATGRCGCVGYTADPAAFGEPTPIVAVTELGLRGPGDPMSSDEPLLAPVRDLLDEGRRLRNLSEPGNLPWRPPR